MGPGPVERRWTSRLHYRALGSWPRSVADERLARAAAMPCPESVKTIMREMYAQAGHPVPPEFR